MSILCICMVPGVVSSMCMALFLAQLRNVFGCDVRWCCCGSAVLQAEDLACAICKAAGQHAAASQASNIRAVPHLLQCEPSRCSAFFLPRHGCCVHVACTVIVNRGCLFSYIGCCRTPLLATNQLSGPMARHLPARNTSGVFCRTAPSALGHCHC